MNALLQDIKDHSLDIYQKHFKSHVDKSIDKIEQTGPGKFVLDSLRSLTIWTITCLVYLYTKFEIAYEKYRLSDDKSSDVKIYKVWCGGNTPKLYEFINKDKNKGSVRDEIGDAYKSDINWYTYFSSNKLKGILIYDIENDNYSKQLVLENNNKFLNAIVKSATDNSETDVTEILNLYTRAKNQKEIALKDIFNLDGKSLVNSEERLVTIDNQANSQEYTLSDKIVF